MERHDPSDDWTRTPARPLGAIVLIGVLLAGCLVGWLGQRGPVSAPGTRETDLARLIDVNTASEAELDLLPGIGPKRAAAIVEERRHAGAFRSLDDLQRVHGIGPRTVEGLRGLATAGEPRTPGG